MSERTIEDVLSEYGAKVAQARRDALDELNRLDPTGAAAARLLRVPAPPSPDLTDEQAALAFERYGSGGVDRGD